MTQTRPAQTRPAQTGRPQETGLTTSTGAVA